MHILFASTGYAIVKHSLQHHHPMNSPDSYDDLVLDVEVLNELSVIEVTLMASMPDLVPTNTDDPDFDFLFGPTFDTLILQHLDEIDAAIEEIYRQKAAVPQSPHFNNTPMLTDSQETLCDDTSPGNSSASLILESPSQSIGKRKATDLEDEEDATQGPSKRGKGDVRGHDIAEEPVFNGPIDVRSSSQ